MTDSLADVEPWLSPTTANRLLVCPFSVIQPPDGRSLPLPPPSQGTSAGALAHAALQRWIESGAWQSGDAGTHLARQFDAVADERGVDTAAILDGRATSARLARRAPELCELLLQFGTDVTAECEVTLYDTARRFWGTADVLLSSAKGLALMDLKAGADAAGSDLPTNIETQLWLYAALVEADRGALPFWLGIYSLRRGARQVPMPDGEPAALLERLSNARAEWAHGQRPVCPSLETCRFCRRRPTCEAHWSALLEWPVPDGLEGQLIQARVAENGRAALLVRTDKQDAWVSNMPATGVVGMTGQWVRVVRVRPRRDPEDGVDLTRWQANEQSAAYAVGEA